jgi:hypothetical protein
VSYCGSGVSAGFTVYLDEGLLKAEYNAMTLSRYKIVSEIPLPKGKATIELDIKFDSPQCEGPATFTVSETFDVGMDLGSPVLLDYHKRATFAFNGKIDRIHIAYTGKERKRFPVVPEDD